MFVKQLSIFIENKTGELAEVTEFLAEKKINLKALSIADTQDFGILRIIVDDPDETADVLRSEGYIVNVTPVLAVEMADKPGSLAKVLKVLANDGVVVEYTYAFLATKAGAAYMIFRVDDNEKAKRILDDNGIHVACLRDIF